MTGLIETPEGRARVALRAWAGSKPGVQRIVPQALRRGERGRFGRYRAGDGGSSPFEFRMGLAEGADTLIDLFLDESLPVLRWERRDYPAHFAARMRRIQESGRGGAGPAGGGSESLAAAAALLGTCETCRETPATDDGEPKHQPWCPEAGGWWCCACRAWCNEGSVECATCRRAKDRAELWSPYQSCPACGNDLEDTQGELAACRCGWEEGE